MALEVSLQGAQPFPDLQPEDEAHHGLQNEAQRSGSCSEGIRDAQTSTAGIFAAQRCGPGSEEGWIVDPLYGGELRRPEGHVHRLVREAAQIPFPGAHDGSPVRHPDAVVVAGKAQQIVVHLVIVARVVNEDVGRRLESRRPVQRAGHDDDLLPRGRLPE